MSTRRIFALGVLLGGGGLLVWSLQGLWRSSRPSEPKIIGRQTLAGLREDADPAVRSLADHPEELKLPPPAGRTVWVRSDEGPPNAPGSLEQPWDDLQTALRRLEPGDRLVLLPGKYRGPFVVDEACADGTAEKPIEVWARVDAVLVSDQPTPVLEARRAHWIFRGFEIEPGPRPSFAFATRGDGAHDILFDHAHLHDGLHSGVLVGPGSARVTIADSHIHIFGPIERGKVMQQLGAGGELPKRVAAIIVAPGTSDTTLAGNNLHNILGPPLMVLEPDQYAAEPGMAKLPPALRVVQRDNRLQENWARGEPTL